MKPIVLITLFSLLITGCTSVSFVPSTSTFTPAPTNTFTPAPTFTSMPTVTSEPSATPTVAVTETPTFVMPEVRKTPLTFFDFAMSRESYHTQPVELEILLNVILPQLGVGKGWSYIDMGGVCNPGLQDNPQDHFSTWDVFPSQTPAKGQENIGYFVSADYITPIIYDAEGYQTIREVSKYCNSSIIPVP